MHICISKLTIIGSDNGLSPGRCQAIIWTSDGILLIGPLETNSCEILIEVYTFALKKIHLKMSSGKWGPFCHGLNVLSWYSWSRSWKHSLMTLTHWGRVTHICISELTMIGSDNGLSPGRRQAIIWNNAGLLLIEPLGTNVSEISIGIQTFSFKKMQLKMSSAKWRPYCLDLDVFIPTNFP